MIVSQRFIYGKGYHGITDALVERLKGTLNSIP